MSQSERDIQRQTVAALRKLGYTVLVTSTNRAARNTRGTPDVLASIGRGLWLGLETKREGGVLSMEQVKMQAAGQILVYTSPEDAIGLVQKARKTR